MVLSREAAQEALVSLTKALEGIRALGAFRSQPQRQYDYVGLDAATLDLVGRDVAAALFHDQVARRAQGKLFKAVNTWLQRMAEVQLVKIGKPDASRSKHFSLEIAGSAARGRKRRRENLADVGFGLGQALPVFVEGLRTQPAGTFIVQEPEIHLHPDAQLIMAEFLVELVRNERRVVVETHSENFLLRIRRAILADDNDRRLDPGDVSVLHVYKQADGASSVERLAVDELGQVEWPNDFMQEAARERLALLQETAERAEAGAKRGG